jgi:hypothetical protein
MKTNTNFSFLAFIALPAGFSDPTIPAAVTYKSPGIADKSYVYITVPNILQPLPLQYRGCGRLY